MSDADLKFNQQEAVLTLSPWIQQSNPESEQLILTGCIPDPRGLGAAELHSATYRANLLAAPSETGPQATEIADAAMRESVLRFASIGTAIVAYATVEATVADCSNGPGYTRDPGSSGYLEEWIDEAFIVD